MGQFDEEGALFQGAESRSKREIARPAFAEGNSQIATPRNLSGLRRDAYIVEVARILKTHFGRVHAHAVKGTARTQREFANDNRAAGFGIALDLDRLDLELLALVNLIDDVDIARGDIGNAGQTDARFHIAELAVEVFQTLHVLVQSLRAVDVAGFHAKHQS